MKLARLLFLLMLLGWASHLRAQTVSTVVSNTLFEPYGVAVDNYDNYYVTDSANQRIVRYQPDQDLLVSLAGAEKVVGSNDGPGYFARFNSPRGLIYDIRRQALIVADSGNNLLRSVSLSQTSRVCVVTTLAGQLRGGYNDGQGTNALFNFPIGLAVDSQGIVYIVDSKNKSIRLLDTQNNVSTLIDGRSLFVRPSAVAVDENQQCLMITDTGMNGIWRVGLAGPERGVASWFAGSPLGLGGSKDDYFATNALLNAPNGISYMGADSGFLICDSGNHVLRRLFLDAELSAFFGNPIWSVQTYAGVAGEAGMKDGLVRESRFNFPISTTRSRNGVTLVVDGMNNTLRQITVKQPPVVKSSKPTLGWLSYYIDPAYPWSSDRYTIFHSFAGREIVLTNAEEVVIFDAYPGTITVWYVSDSTVVGTEGNSLPAEPGTTIQATYVHDVDGTKESDLPKNAAVVRVNAEYGPSFSLIFNGKEGDSKTSDLVSYHCQYKVAKPTIVAENPFSPVLYCDTRQAKLYWTTNLDVEFPDFTTNLLQYSNVFYGPYAPGVNIRLDFAGEVKIRLKGYREGFVPSDETPPLTLSTESFAANRICFGFEQGEASSDFIIGPGQSYFAPVVLDLLPGQKMYSLQFGLVAVGRDTNVPPPMPMGFYSTLAQPVQVGTAKIYVQIPPAAYLFSPYSFIEDFPPNWKQQIKYLNPDILDDAAGLGSGSFLPFLVTNQNQNLLMVGWFERYEHIQLYNTTLHHLIAFSQPHNRVWKSIGGQAVVGGYKLGIPLNTLPGSTSEIAIIRPSATADGISEDVFIYTPSPPNGIVGSAKSAVKRLVVGEPGYVVGDVEPFRWFNAGEFGDDEQPAILNNDIMQVFQYCYSEIRATDGTVYTSGYQRPPPPPLDSDFVDAMDSSDSANAANKDLILIPAKPDGSDAYIIDNMLYGDKQLDISDMYVTFRRSLDPSLKWYYRYHTTNGLAAKRVPNTYRGWTNYPGSFHDKPAGELSSSQPVTTVDTLSTQTCTAKPALAFVAQDVRAEAGQTISVPIRAAITGGLPIRSLMLMVQIDALNGTPPITSQINFVPASGLGKAIYMNSLLPNSIGGAWLDLGASGLWGDTLAGHLVVALPTNASPESVYRIQFDHVSASPNGLGLFPRQLQHGLITFRDTTQSSWNDGISDSWRLRFFGSLSNILSHAQADADGDGVPNWVEWKSGTNPVDIDSKLKVWLSQKHGIPVVPEEGSVVIRWPSAWNKIYVVESASSVGSSASWTPLATGIMGTGGELDYTDICPQGPRFYRVRVVE